MAAPDAAHSAASLSSAILRGGGHGDKQESEHDSEQRFHFNLPNEYASAIEGRARKLLLRRAIH
jgi:hypothetical protein